MTFVTIRDVSNVVSKGTTPTSVGLSFSVNGVPFLKGEDVLGKAIDFFKATTYISEESHEILKRSELIVGDVLVTIAGTIGRIGFIGDKGCTANCNQAVAFIRPDLNRVDPEWLCYLLQSPTYQVKFSKFVAGGAIPNVNLQQIKSIEIPSVTITKQRQIATQLKAQLAEVKKARQAADVQLRDAVILKSKALESIFGSIKEWEPIGTFAKVQSGYAFKSDTFQATGTRLLRNANILPGKVYWDESVSLNDKDAEKFPTYKLNEDDILISLDRPIISSGIKVAQVSYRDLPALLVQRVGRFLIDHKRIDSDFLYAYLQTEQFISEIIGHDQSLGVPHISPSQVESIKIPLPKLSTQQKLSNKLNEIMRLWRETTIASQTQLNDIDILPQKILAQVFEN